MGVTTFEPYADVTLSNWRAMTLFGSAATIWQAHGDASDATGSHFGTSNSGISDPANTGADFTAVFYKPASGGLTLAAPTRVDWIRVDYRARHVSNHSMIWAHSFVAWDSHDVPHWRPMAVVDPGGFAAAAAPIDHSTPATTNFPDGTPYSDCHNFHVYWGRWGPNAPPGLEGGWDSSNYPYITKSYLTVGYTLQPTVTNITPNTTTDDSTPTFAWTPGNIEEKLPSAFEFVILPTGSTDRTGKHIGDAGFEPWSGSGMEFATGKVFTSNATVNVTKPLAPAVWHAFIKQYVGSGIDEYASDWAHQSFTIEALTVDNPAVSLTDDATSNTLKVTITAGPTTQDLRAETIEVQYLDPVDGWIAAPIANSMVNGTGVSAFYDGLHAPGESVSYRARGVATDSGFLYVSPWTTATHTVADLHQWWLRSSSDYTLNRSLNDTETLLMKTWAPTRARPNVTSWGIGARPATQVHDITKGDTHECTIWAMTKAAYTGLRALLEDGDDLVLVNPWGEIWRVQPVGDVKEEVLRAAPRQGESSPLGFVRVITVSLVEVVTP